MNKVMNGIKRIAAERQRQVEQEGWTPEHDDKHTGGELSSAARAYRRAAYFIFQGDTVERARAKAVAFWPWEESWFKVSPDRARNLEKAGALYVADKERIVRAAGAENVLVENLDHVIENIGREIDSIAANPQTITFREALDQSNEDGEMTPEDYAFWDEECKKEGK
jgi:hypothetical protein